MLKTFANLPKEHLMRTQHEDPSRRQFLAAGLSGSLLAAGSAELLRASQDREPQFELAELTIGELQDGLKAGKFSARSLAEKYLARIDAVDRQGPTLRSVIEIN